MPAHISEPLLHHDLNMRASTVVMGHDCEIQSLNMNPAALQKSNVKHFVANGASVENN